MPGAWHDDDRQRAEDGYDNAPPGASAAEELAHEIALAAALDRSRPSLSADPQASERMRRRLFEAMAEHTAGRPGPSELTTPLGSPIRDAGPLTEPVGRPVPAGLAPSASGDPGPSVGRAAGERTLTGSAAGRGRRARHVLPDGHPDQAPSRPSDGRPSSGPSARRRPSVRKRFGVVVAAVAALAVLAGMAATASRNALPGDALYGVKRVTESTGGIFTFGDQAEALRQLDLARTRIDEIETLMGRGTPPDPATVTAAIDDFDTATSNGTRLMLSQDRTAGGSQLADLRTWAAAQSGRMEQLRTTMPQASMAEADDSIALLERVRARTEALRARTGCTGSDSDSVDDLGPMPQSGTCAPDPGAAAAAPDRSTPGSGETGTPTPVASDDPSGSSTPDPSTGDTSEQPGLGPVLAGDPARAQSGEPITPPGPSGVSSSSTSTTSTVGKPQPLLPPITLPPLLPGIGPVTIG